MIMPRLLVLCSSSPGTWEARTLRSPRKSQLDVQGHSLVTAPVLELLFCFVP